MVRTVKNAAERKEEIIQAACHLFLTKGYEKSTMKDVMTKVNIAKGTIYHYFKSKEELLDEVIATIVAETLERQEKISNQATGNALEKMKMLIVSGMDDHETELIANLHMPANAGMHIRLIAQLITLQAPMYADLIQQGCDEGIFETECPLECAEFILAGSQFLTDTGVYPWTQDQLQRRAMALPGLIEAQVKAPPGSFNFIIELLV